MRLAVVTTAALLSVCSCAFITESPRFAPRQELGHSFTEYGPAKVHMLDGSVVIVTSAISVRHDTLYPVVQPAVVSPTPVWQRRVRPSVKPVVRTVHGIRYDLTRQHRFEVEAVPMESVVGIEHYDRHTNVGPTLTWAPVLVAGIVCVGVLVYPSMLFEPIW